MSDQLRHKLLNYEVAPPLKAWEGISEALEDQGSALAERLYQYEQAPSGRTWQHIEKELDAEPAESRPAVPFYKRYRRPLRFAGAAAILVAVALITILLVNQNKGTIDMAQGPQNRTSGDRTPPASTEAATNKQDDVAGNSQSNNAPNRSDEGDRTTTDPRSSNPPIAASPSTRPSANRYLTVASEEGKPVRLSKKVYPVFDCAEHSTAVKRYRCQENIEALQQKMASSLASPSGDFASLMDMIKTLEENP